MPRAIPLTSAFLFRLPIATIFTLTIFATSAAFTQGCARTPVHTAATSHLAAKVHGPDASPKAPLDWAPFDGSTFERAKKERKFIVLDGAAEWCHWCHVMESTTYHDLTVARILRQDFIAAKVDIDARPDIEERYRAWGWPATVIFSPDGDELGTYRGYIAPDEFAEILKSIVASKDARPNDAARAGSASTGSASAGSARTVSVPDAPMPREMLAWASRWAEIELEEYWDPKEGGWGVQPKVPIHGNTEFALRRAARGDIRRREHALTVLDKQRSIIDPVWGGIYQYSVAPDWVHPHFEKLMESNAGALADYANAYALTKDERWLRAARDIDRYLRGFLLAPDGAFYGTQDADLNAHEPGERFVDGHDYYKLGDGERRKLGIPRIDTNEYAKDSGLAIDAYVVLYEATGDRSALAIAQRARARIVRAHTTRRGAVSHAASNEPAVLHLADNAAFGYALVRLYGIDRDAATLEAAKGIARFAVSELLDRSEGGFFAHTEDPAAVGVFRHRRKPFSENVLMLRFLQALQKIAPDPVFARAMDKSLRYLTEPERIKEAGRFIGDYLSLLDAIP